MIDQQAIERERNLEQQRLEFRKQAYSDFLQGQTLLRENRMQVQLITSASLRIILTGSNKVVCSMAEYFATKYNYPECTEVDEKKKDAAIYRNMRDEFFRSLGAQESSAIDDAVLVPYLRNCVLPGEKIEQVCKRLINEN